MRSRLIGLVVLAVVAGCTDSTPTSTLKHPGSTPLKVVVSGSLDQNIQSLIALWPQGLSTASGTRWQNIKDSYSAGQISVAKSKLVELTKFIIMKTNDMTTPPTGETKPAAAARLVLYMSLYIYNGPNTTPPDFTPSADNAIGVLTASAPLTVVTPSQHAGAQFDAGSTDVDRIIVITQNPTYYPDNCSGPLQTTACQYPLFYNISSFPDTKLLKMAKASICHVNDGANRAPLPGVNHDRFRLAHAKPANPADYTPGSTIREGIEVLPLISQSFVICPESSVQYGSPVVIGNLLERGLKQLASRIGKWLTPGSAYAIDQGGGGGFEVFSPFNDVDTLSQQNLDVQNYAPPAGPLASGSNSSVTFDVTNIGTGTNDAATATVRISTDATITTADQLLATVSVPSLPPGSTFTASSVAVTIPSSLAAGNYYIGVLINDVTTTPDSDLSNNTESSALVVNEPAGPSPMVADFETPSLGATPRAVSNPYSVGYMTFSTSDLTFNDAVVGLVQNYASDACVPPESSNQQLGTGRYPYIPDGGISTGGFPIRVDFGTALNSAQSAVVEVHAGGGSTATLTLYNAGGTQVGQNSAVVPSTGLCAGWSGGNRGIAYLTASGTQAKYAIITVSGSVFTIDNFAVQDPVILF